MQAMNLHPAQQDILLNLLNVQPGQAQGMSKLPQGEMSFSSMLERADKTYSTEGKNTQKTQDASPKSEISSEKDQPHYEKDIRNERQDTRAEKAEVRDEMKTEETESAFDADKADAEIEKFSVKNEEELSEELVKSGDIAEKACLTMPDSDEITDPDAGKIGVETVIPEAESVSVDNLEAEDLENMKPADRNALSARLETKPVMEAAATQESEKAADESEKADGLSSDKKTKKKGDLSDGKEAASLVQANDAAKPLQTLSDADSTVLAASQVKAETKTPDSKIEIIDERTHAESSDVTLNTTTTVSADGASAEMIMTLPVQAAGSEANGSMEAGYNKADFAQMLNNSVAASTDEFVKTGSILLQDNKKGSINLILHPEELGNVKVKLELSDNQITGKIVVASKEAYDAFKANLEDIKNAFVANGFDACGFDLAWAGAGDSNGSQGQNAADNGSMNQFGLQYYGTAYEDDLPVSVPEYFTDNTHINLVA